MSLAPYVRILGRGPSRSRSLTRDEARDAMRLILEGKQAPEAIGALLMLMRFRGESAEEIAGFTAALKSDLSAWSTVSSALDWPSYAAGRSRGAPWFLLSAKLVARAGYPVFLHGWNSHQNPVASVSDAVGALGIPTASRPETAQNALAAQGIVYVSAAHLHAPALELLKLRDVLGLRSCLNTVFRMLNPTGAQAIVQGVFHPSYRDLQSDAGQLLGQSALSVIKGGGGEFERHPAKTIALYGLRNGDPFEQAAPPLVDETRRLHDGPEVALTDLWAGSAEDAFAEAAITGTAALALLTLGAAQDLAAAQAMAEDLWASRHRAQAA